MAPDLANPPKTILAASISSQRKSRNTKGPRFRSKEERLPSEMALTAPKVGILSILSPLQTRSSNGERGRSEKNRIHSSKKEERSTRIERVERGKAWLSCGHG